jgi:hypothetical protein
MVLGTQLQIGIGNNEVHEKIYSQELNEIMKPQNFGAASNDLYWPKLVWFGNASYEVLLLQARDDATNLQQKTRNWLFYFFVLFGTRYKRLRSDRL